MRSFNLGQIRGFFFYDINKKNPASFLADHALFFFVKIANFTIFFVKFETYSN